MDQALMEQLKNQLQTKKRQLELELSKFATKDPNLKDDWDTTYPNVPGGSSLEEEADEVEEYESRLGVEHALEMQLRDVNDALQRIEKGKFGLCEKCGKAITIERLKASPETHFCQNCNIENSSPK